MYNHRAFLPVFFLLLINFTGISAQTNEEGDTLTQKLVVGLSEKPPYMMRTEDGLWDGVSVDLWRQVADEMDLVFEFREVPYDSLLILVAEGELDVTLGVEASAEGEEEVDFSPVYYVSGLGVAGINSQSLASIARGIFTYQFLKITLWISSLLLIVGVVIWFVERRANKEQFGGDRSIWSGIGSGFWWAGVTMTTIGYGDKAPVTFLGRALALLWMLVGLAITASLTAAIVAAIGIDGGKEVNSVEDFRGRKVGVVAGSPTAAFLKDERVDFIAYETAIEGLQALEKDEIEVFVDDVARIRYYLNEDSDLRSEAEAVQLHHRYHVFALQDDLPMQERLNRVMQEIVTDPLFSNLLNRYVPK